MSAKNVRDLRRARQFNLPKLPPQHSPRDNSTNDNFRSERHSKYLTIGERNEPIRRSQAAIQDTRRTEVIVSKRKTNDHLGQYTEPYSNKSNYESSFIKNDAQDSTVPKILENSLRSNQSSHYNVPDRNVDGSKKEESKEEDEKVIIGDSDDEEPDKC